MKKTLPPQPVQFSRQLTNQDSWRLLLVANLIRGILGALVLVIGNAPGGMAVLNPHYPEWFGWSGGMLLAASLTWWMTIERQWPRFTLQSYLQIATDLVLLGALVTCVGVDRGMGVLLMLPVFLCSLLLERWTAYIAAAVAYFTVVIIQFLALTAGLIPNADYTQIGTLGMVFFMTALVGHLSAQRARSSESRAQEAGVDLRNISELNRHVIGDMDIGVIVVDSDARIRLLNAAAQRLLGLRQFAINSAVGRLSPVLAARLGAWRKAPAKPVAGFTSESRRLMPTFRELGPEGGGGVLVYLEDAERINQRVQQAKLASLGRLTASIAHEIRNPLAAISHASQLLDEFEDMSSEMLHLTSIVNRNVRRMNETIENVLQLSRRQKSRPERLSLPVEIGRFVQEFRDSHKLPDSNPQVNSSMELDVEFDPGQLQQVLHGLGANALKHAARGKRPPQLTISWLRRDNEIALSIQDDGPGVNTAIVERIFDPFFSSAKEGTGLGLFILRELCEANNARLELANSQVASAEAGACFRILFYD